MRKKTFRSPVSAVLAVGVVLAALTAFAQPAAAAAPQIDVEIAFDTTTSMGASVRQAQEDGKKIVAQVQQKFPDARFAVVSFRDVGYPGEYQLLQAMTSSSETVQAALERLETSSGPPSGNTLAEGYNLAFHQSYTDPAIGWRPEARKFVVVVGDAEPHGAGTAGFAGCKDTTRDPHGLNTASVLTAMRKSERTLIMIRQVAEYTTAELACYESLAAAAFGGGAARNGGSEDLAAPIVNLIQQAFAPVSIAADGRFARPGGTSGFTVRLKNPNPFAITLASVSATLPLGAAYRAGSTSGPGAPAPSSGGRAPVWRPGAVLQPSETFALHFVARMPRRLGRYAVTASATVQPAAGRETLSATARSSSVRVGRAPRRFRFTFAGRTGSRVLTGAGVSRSRLGSKWLAGRIAKSRITLAFGSSVRLRARSYRFLRVGAPTVLRLRAVVTSSRRSSCRVGSAAAVTVVDSNRLLRNAQTADRIRVAFAPRGCRSLNHSSSNSRGTAQVRVQLT